MPKKKYFTEEERKAANNLRSRLWNKDNKERAYANHLKYRKTHRSRLNAKAIEWRKNNTTERLKRRRELAKKRKENDPFYKFSENIRTLISVSFKKNKGIQKRAKTEEILGCTIKDFTKYILNKCPEGVTIKDFGKYGYHLDHIIPISTAKTEEEAKRLCHYTNFQPLFWRDNIAKSNKKINK